MWQPWKKDIKEMYNSIHDLYDSIIGFKERYNYEKDRQDKLESRIYNLEKIVLGNQKTEKRYILRKKLMDCLSSREKTINDYADKILKILEDNENDR